MPQMINAMSPEGNAVAVDISSTDYTYAGTVRTKGLLVADGTVLKFDKVNDDATTVVCYMPCPGELALNGIKKIYKTGTDATLITLITE